MYNNFLREVFSEVSNNTENYLEHTFLEDSTKLEFQERNSSHHHERFWLACGVIEDVEEIGTMI